MSKKYFRETEEDHCYSMPVIKKMMKRHKCKEQKLFEAKMMTGFEYFYCREFKEVGEVGEGCGKQCESYLPRNGKSGRCKKSANLYERTENSIVAKIK